MFTNPYLGEFVGTMFLILFGDGVVANIILNKSKGWALSGNGSGSGWISITAGWAFAVMVGVATAIWFGSPWASINPAVTIALAIDGKLSWDMVPGFIIAEILGAFFGAILVYVTYRDHYKVTEDPITKLATFSTIPNIRHIPQNFVTEAVGTFALIIGVYGLVTPPAISKLAPGAITVAFLVFGIGLSLGGPTGYAINPARDLGPRMAHALIFRKESSDWTYGLTVPIFGPIVGAIVAGLIAMAIF
jgi:glycerol uptake facilitator protein